MKGFPKELLEVVEFKHNTNTTEPPEISKIIYPLVECDDCGEQVQDRRISSRQHLTPYLHWRQQCSICKQFKNPETGEYDSTSQEVTSFYHNLRRTNKYKCKSK
jgi:hypothetical protein